MNTPLPQTDPIIKYPTTLNSSPSQEKQIINIKQKIQEYRAAVLFEDFSDLFEFDDNINIQDNNNQKPKDEEYLAIGDEKTIEERNFIQVDIGKLRGDKNSMSNISNLDNPKIYFQKILVFRIKDQYYATGSFCGYDLTDLKEGAFIGNKIICPSCLSEYNIENGRAESGPNTKYLSKFHVALRSKKLLLRLPTERVPLFSLGPVAEPGNELDPRHYVLIGDNETVAGAVDSLTKVFTGKLSIITNRCGNDFVDSNKLTKSFFPLKMKQSKMLTKDFLEAFKINIYDEKVLSIDSNTRLIKLESGASLPFDKVLIAVGSKRMGVNKKYDNTFQLNSLRDHSRIHNAVIKEHVKAVTIIGNNMRALEIASSMRRYLDAISKEVTKVYIICPNENFFLEKLASEECLKIIQEYLLRNRIFLFRGHTEMDFEEDINENKLLSTILVGKKHVYRLPADVYIIENGLGASNCDFVDRITASSTAKLSEDSFETLYGNILIPDDRMSLHKSDRYPHIFTAGSCACIDSYIMKGPIRTDNMKANFVLGHHAMLNMSEVHYPFDDIIVNSAKILDKNLYFLGNENNSWTDMQVHLDDKQEKFIVYLFNGKQITSVLMYGYNRFHLFLREAMRLKMMPDLDYSKEHKDQLHLLITKEVLKKSDIIECYKHKALYEAYQINTSKYAIEDQPYVDDLMKRGLKAYETYKSNTKKEWKKNDDEREKERKKKEKQD